MSKKDEMANILLRLPMELREQLNELGKRVDRSVNYLVVEACRRYLESIEAKERLPSDFVMKVDNNVVEGEIKSVTVRNANLGGKVEIVDNFDFGS
jgi:predicted DNA-binding protein